MNRHMLRHLLATLALRTEHALVGAPAGFASFTPGAGVRTPLEILRHMTGLLAYLQRHFDPAAPRPAADLDWEAEIEQFRSALRGLDQALVEGELQGETRGGRPFTEEIMLQGPLADALTHTGQLIMLRRLAGAPVERISYMEQPIEAGRFTYLNPA